MSKKQIKRNPSTYRPLSEQTGNIGTPLTNDILFKLLMQKNQDTLKAFLCALLKLNPSDITSVQITNPYVLGEVVTDKQIILDINLIVNNSQIINLEMQVLNKGDWKERSLYYMCQNFNSLKQGNTYIDLMPTHHIGILDFTLPDLSDTFYHNFYLMDEKSHKIYSDKLILSVLNLKQINLATDEDKSSGLQYWAQLFKTTTWEELKMLAEQNDIFASAAKTVNELLQEHRVRYECERRQMDLNAELKFHARYNEMEVENKSQADTITHQADTITELRDKNKRLQDEHDAEKTRLQDEHNAEKARIQDEHNAEKARIQAEHDAEIARLKEEFLKAQQQNK